MTEQHSATTQAELPRPIKADELAGDAPVEIELVATAAERAALAARCALVSLDALRAQISVRRDASGDIVVSGHLEAELVQECVVTLEPVSESVSAPFEQRYTLRPSGPVGDLALGPDDAEPPEAIEGDAIDVGELVAQFLSLSINPYPRSPEADTLTEQYRGEGPREGPFAVLAKLRQSDQR